MVTFHERRMAALARICAEMEWPMPENPTITTVSHWIWLECGIQAVGEMLDEVTKDDMSPLRLGE